MKTNLLILRNQYILDSIKFREAVALSSGDAYPNIEELNIEFLYYWNTLDRKTKIRVAADARDYCILSGF